MAEGEADLATRRRVPAGARAPVRALQTLAGETIGIPDPDRLIHLQFRRFAGCPVCNLHLRSIVRRHGEIAAVGVREVVVFHSSEAELRPQVRDLPFDIVADPGKALYVAFGVEAGRRALLDPRAWLPIVGAISVGVWEILLRRRRAEVLAAEGGRLGLPADFLIGRDGRIAASKYGEHVYDQWEVDEILHLARQAQA